MDQYDGGRISVGSVRCVDMGGGGGGRRVCQAYGHLHAKTPPPPTFKWLLLFYLNVIFYTQTCFNINSVVK